MTIIIGSILFTAGYLVRLIAMRTNRDFTITLQEPNAICNKGIYRFVRHPSYVGSMLTLAGAFLICPLFGFLYLVVVFYLARVVEEEKFLRRLKEYQDYAKKTGMFIPKIRRK